MYDDRRPYAPRLTGEQRTQTAAELAARYEAGDSIRAIARDTGRSYGATHRLLAEAGVTFRPRGTHRLVGTLTALLVLAAFTLTGCQADWDDSRCVVTAPRPAATRSHR